jgi:hypothetical protein
MRDAPQDEGLQKTLMVRSRAPSRGVSNHGAQALRTDLESELRSPRTPQGGGIRKSPVSVVTPRQVKLRLTPRGAARP